MPLLQTPASSALGKVLRWPLRWIPKSTVVRVRRGINAGMKWRVGAHTHGCWLGTYELAKQQAVSRLVRAGMNVVDIGANAGFYTLAFSRLVGSSGHVWAFEPLAANVAKLLHHASLNRLDNVTVVQCALAETAALRGFRRAAHDAMGALTADANDYLVPTARLDDFPMPVPDLVKIDVEGGELAVLRGAARLIAQRRTTWLVALDDPDHAAACRALLEQERYEITELGSPDEIAAIPRN